MEIQIKRFDPDNIVNKRHQYSSPITVVIGKRNTGKSQLIKSILYANKDIPSGIVISPTDAGNSFYSSFCPEIFIHYQYNPKLLKNIIKRQKKKIKKYGKIPNNDFFIVLDDCMYNTRAINRDVHLREIFLNGRHLQIYLIMSVQYVMDLPVSLRSNIDYVFCMKENNLQNIDKLYKSFFGVFPSKSSFTQAFSKMTDNYGSMVLDNTSRSSHLDSCIFWFRAKFPSPEFKLGNSQIWLLNNIILKKKNDYDISSSSSSSEGHEQKKKKRSKKNKADSILKTIMKK